MVFYTFRSTTMEFTFPAIGIIRSCFNEKFATPRQPGLAAHATAQLELQPPYNQAEALAGLELCSHIWVQFVFHANQRKTWSAKVRPPRLGGNRSMGVFATRSPIRPSPIGLSVVKLEAVHCEADRCWLELSGVDMIDGTPVLDIKPYVPYVDCVPSATNAFANQPPQTIPVLVSAEAESSLVQLAQREPVRYGHLRELLTEVLQQDPRPAYQQPDEHRLYGALLCDVNVRWRYHINPLAIEVIKIN